MSEGNQKIGGWGCIPGKFFGATPFRLASISLSIQQDSQQEKLENLTQK